MTARYAIACDAISNEKSHAETAAAQYLAALNAEFDAFTVEVRGRGPQDEKVIAALNAAHPFLIEYLQFVRLLARSGHCRELISVVIDFLGELLRLKLAPERIANEALLNSDAHRFLLREIFLVTMALLIRCERYGEVRNFLEAGYSYSGAERRETYSYRRFDGYVKTLDEFRNRRLQLNRRSVASDLLKERTDKSFFSYAELMQADFILFLRSILHYESSLIRWYPRTLVNAARFQKSGFPLFRPRTDFRPLRQMLAIDSRHMLFEAVNVARARHKLDEWRIGDVAFDFGGFMAFGDDPDKHDGQERASRSAIR